MQSARAQGAARPARAVHEPVRAHRRPRGPARPRALDLAPVGPVAEDVAAQLRRARAQRGIAGTSAGTRFSGMWRPANTSAGSAGSGRGPLERARVLAREHRRLAAQALAAQPRARAGARSRTRAGARARRAAAPRQPKRLPAGPRYSRQYVARPHLVPVHYQPVAAAAAAAPRPPAARSRGTRPCAPRRSRAPWRSRCASTPAPNTSGGAIRRRPSRYSVEPRPHGDHAHAGEVGLLASAPTGGA